MASDVQAGKAFIRLEIDDRTRESIKRAQAQLLAFGDVASQITQEVTASTTAVLSQASAKMTATGQSVSAETNGIMAQIASGVAQAFAAVNSASSYVRDQISAVAQSQSVLLAALKPVGELVVKYFVESTESIIHLVNAVANVVTAIATATMAAMQFGAAFGGASDAASQSQSALSTAFGIASSQLSALVAVIQGSLSPLLSAVTGQLQLFAEVLGNQFATIGAALAMPIKQIANLIAAINILMGLPSKLRSAFVSAFTAIPRAIGAAVTATVSLAKTAFQSLATAAASAARTAVSAISSAVRSLASAVAGAIKQVAGLAVSAVGALARISFNPGQSIVMPLTNALAGGANMVAGFLGSIQSGLNAVASRVAYVGGAISGIGAAVVVPLTAAAKQFMDAGVEADQLASKLNMSVQAAQELNYAAGKLNISPDQVTKASSSASEYVTSNANAGTNGALADIGLQAKDLARMNVEDQFTAIGVAIERTIDPLKKAEAAQAIFGDGAEKLGPLFRDNGAALGKYAAEANNLGIVMGGAAVTSAVALSDAYRFLKDATAGLWQTLGQAVAPAITEMTQQMAVAISAVTRWVAANQPLIAQIFSIATKVATVGSVVLSVAGVFGGMASVFGMLSGAAASVATAITVVGGVAAAVLSPIAALAVAAAGVAVWLGRTAVVQDAASHAIQAGAGAWGSVSDAAQRAYIVVVDVWGKIQQFTTEVFGGIKDAIAAGDLELAVEIAWLGAQTAWAKGMAWIAGYTQGAMGGILNALSTGDFSTAFDIAWTEIKILFAQGVGQIQSLWVGLQNTFDMVATYLRQTWNEVLKYLAQQTLGLVHDLQGMLLKIAQADPTGILGTKVSDLNNAISKGVAGSGLEKTAYGGVGKQNAELDQQMKDRQAERNAGLEAQQAEQAKAIGELKDVLKKLSDGAEGKSGVRMTELQQQLAAALSEAAKATPLFDLSAPARDANRAKGADDQKTTTKQTVGTFSAAGAARLGLGFNRSEALLEQIAKNTAAAVPKNGKDWASDAWQEMNRVEPG